MTALSFVSKYPDDPRLVTALGALARDEAGHFTRVAELCVERGLALGHPEKDPYVEALLGRCRNSSVLDGRVDRLLCCALIEGRSCERLQLLAEALPNIRGAPLGTGQVDDVVCALYAELWREEATHHTLFIELAERTLQRAGSPCSTKSASDRTRARLEELSLWEGELLARLPVRAAIH